MESELGKWAGYGNAGSLKTELLISSVADLIRFLQLACGPDPATPKILLTATRMFSSRITLESVVNFTRNAVNSY